MGPKKEDKPKADSNGDSKAKKEDKSKDKKTSKSGPVELKTVAYFPRFPNQNQTWFDMNWGFGPNYD